MKRTPRHKVRRQGTLSRHLFHASGRLKVLGQTLMALLGAGLSLYLPSVFDVFPRILPGLFSGLQQDGADLVTGRGIGSVCLVALLFALRSARRDRRLAAEARSAGLVPSRRVVSRPRTSRVRPKVGLTDIMIIGATGRSFSHQEGALAAALHGCREARIMLLDPREHGALARIQSIRDPEITIEAVHLQIASSIEFLRGLRSAGRTILLKLYPDMPLFKLEIMNGFASLRHYHPGLNVREMPQFTFRDAGVNGGLYLPLYRYFVSRWQDPDIPEYDFASDELVYHDQLGAEVLREPFSSMVTAAGSREGEAESRRSYIFRSDDVEDQRKGESLIPSER